MAHGFAVGLDYGTESCRAVLLNLASAEVVTSSVYAYPHGVVDRTLPGSGERLPQSWALQYPGDYLNGLKTTVRAVVKESGVDPAEIGSLGIDTTACTLIPTAGQLRPLALDDKWQNNPYAWAKLWKDHSAQPQADRINMLGADRKEEFLKFYSGRLSSEWAFPKLLKLYEEAPDVFSAAAKVYELCDWLVSLLVGAECRGAAVAGYKETYQPTTGGYPDAKFLEELASGFSAVTAKLGSEFKAPGASAGTITSEWATELGLTPDTIIASSNLDAHVAALGVGISNPNEMLLVMGTSVCNLMMTRDFKEVRGVSGTVFDGLAPGYWAYEAGQSGVGDTFGWFVNNLVPERIQREAQAANSDIFSLLERRAQTMNPGETGLLCLDWFNGNRSTLQDGGLSGLVMGLTIGTRAEDVYRCLLEGAAFGQRQIFDAFADAGVEIERVVACGGIALKSPLFMQILADVLNRPVEVNSSMQGPAVGAALHAAVAAGETRGGFSSFEAACEIAPATAATYEPDPARSLRYAPLLKLYKQLYDEFGDKQPDRMHMLRDISAKASVH